MKFEEIYGYPKIDKKWMALIEQVRTGTPDSKTNLICVHYGNFYVTDGVQILKADVACGGLTNSDYVLSKDGYLMLNRDERIEFPDVMTHTKKDDRDRSAIVHNFCDNPLVATAHILKEFGVTVNLDLHRGTLIAAASLDPDHVRVYGYKHEAENEINPAILEFTYDEGASFELILCGIKDSKFIEDDKTPLFDQKKDAA